VQRFDADTGFDDGRPASATGWRPKNLPKIFVPVPAACDWMRAHPGPDFDG
jgi:hypothetical protein